MYGAIHTQKRLYILLPLLGNYLHKNNGFLEWMISKSVVPSEQMWKFIAYCFGIWDDPLAHLVEYPLHIYEF